MGVIKLLHIFLVLTSHCRMSISSTSRYFVQNELNAGVNTRLPPSEYIVVNVGGHHIKCAARCTQEQPFCYGYLFSEGTQECGIYQAQPPPAAQGINLTLVNGHHLYTSYGRYIVSVATTILRSEGHNVLCVRGTGQKYDTVVIVDLKNGLNLQTLSP